MAQIGDEVSVLLSMYAISHVNIGLPNPDKSLGSSLYILWSYFFLKSFQLLAQQESIPDFYPLAMCMDKVVGEPFNHLLTYGSPIRDSIIYTMLHLIHKATEIQFTDTFFIPALHALGWSYAYEKFF